MGLSRKQNAEAGSPCYFGCVGGVGRGVVGGVASGFFVAGFFFFATGFFGGSLSSTTFFLGGAVGIAAWAVFRSVLKRTISCSFDAARLASRSASCFREASKLFRSLDSD